jgi:polyisoprenoid-binding protein YceI
VRRTRVLAILLVIAGPKVYAQNLTLQFDADNTKVNFTLADVLHTVHGTFRLKNGSVDFDPGSGKLRGEIVVDTGSGETGNGMRDRKMQREVLESGRFPEIRFAPDREEGTVALQGKSSLKVHGIFAIHGSEHEFTAPGEVEIFQDHWNATLHFNIPYVNWGMKNPSTLFLRVGESVEIEVDAVGTVTRH